VSAPGARDEPRSATRVAIAGYGYWGPNLARVVDECVDAELRAIFDGTEEARLRAQLRHPQANIVSEWDALLDDAEIDAVVVALPVPLHFQFALEALESGKHVLVEKPMARTTSECDRLAAAAESRDLVLMAGHSLEYHAAVEKVKAYLEAGELGEPYYITTRRTNLGIVRSDTNAMWNLAPHDISILCYWLDREPVEVSAEGVARLQEGIEDVVFMTVKFEGDVLCHVHCSWLDPHKAREATVIGSEKMAVYDDVSMEAKVRLYDKGVVRADATEETLGRFEDFGRFQLLARAGDVLIPKLDFREPLAVEIDHFAECVRRAEEPRSGAASARRVVAVLEAAETSLREGGSQPVAPAQVS
jgi:predicted dehydrogenase